MARQNSLVVMIFVVGLCACRSAEQGQGAPADPPPENESSPTKQRTRLDPPAPDEVRRLKPSTQNRDSEGPQVKRSPDYELLAAPAQLPVSFIPPQSWATTPDRAPIVDTARFASAEGVLQRKGPCLFLKSTYLNLALVFRTESARFDPVSNELFTSEARVAVGQTMFVRASRRMRRGMNVEQAKPPIPAECGEEFWVVNEIGKGLPSAKDLGCDVPIQEHLHLRPRLGPTTLVGGLTHPDQTFRILRQNFGIIRLCAEKHLKRQIGTVLNTRMAVDVSAKGNVTKVEFLGGSERAFEQCLNDDIKVRTVFPTAAEDSRITVGIRVELGYSSYQIEGCDRVRAKE